MILALVINTPDISISTDWDSFVMFLFDDYICPGYSLSEAEEMCIKWCRISANAHLIITVECFNMYINAGPDWNPSHDAFPPENIPPPPAENSSKPPPATIKLHFQFI